MKFKSAILLLFLMLSIYTFNVRADGMVDIKRLVIGTVRQENRVAVKITLENTTETEIKIDNVLLSVTAFDGKPKMSDSKKIKKNLQPQQEQTFDLEFKNGLQAGDYIGLVEVYSKNVNLGGSKTNFAVGSPASQVLGTASVINNLEFKILVIIFAWIFLFTSFLIYKNYNFLQKGISFKVHHLVLLLAIFSSLGFGFVGGYMICDRIFPQYTSNRAIEEKDSANDLSGGEYDVNFVFKENSLKLYPKPDSKLQIAYELKEDVGLIIIDQVAGWYRVILADNRHGWVRIEDL